eukprot:446265_1
MSQPLQLYRRATGPNQQTSTPPAANSASSPVTQNVTSPSTPVLAKPAVTQNSTATAPLVNVVPATATAPLTNDTPVVATTTPVEQTKTRTFAGFKDNRAPQAAPQEGRDLAAGGPTSR